MLYALIQGLNTETGGIRRCERLLGLRRALSFALPATAATTHTLLHLFELLLLLVVQHCLNFVLRVLPDRLHLRVPVLARHGLILKERFCLLLAIDEDGTDLILLVGVQSERARHVLELPIGIHARGTGTGRRTGLRLSLIGSLRLGLRWVVLCERGNSKGECCAKGEDEKCVSHWVELPPIVSGTMARAAGDEPGSTICSG